MLDSTQQVYLDAVPDFLRTKAIDKPKVKIENILRVDLIVPLRAPFSTSVRFDDLPVTGFIEVERKKKPRL